MKKILLMFVLLVSSFSLTACDEKEEKVYLMTKLDFLVDMNDARVSLWENTSLSGFKSELNGAIDYFNNNYASRDDEFYYDLYLSLEEESGNEITNSLKADIQKSAEYAEKIINVVQSVCDVLEVEENQNHLYAFINAKEDTIEELNGYLVIARALAPTRAILDMEERDALWDVIKTNSSCACSLFNNSYYTLYGNDSTITGVSDFITTVYVDGTYTELCDDCSYTLTAAASDLIAYRTVVQTYLSNVDTTLF